MAGSTYSSNLKIELMSTGENSGTWGDITNTNMGTALEQAIVGLGNPDFIADANLTISITNTNAAQAARALVLNVTSVFGSLTATRELVVPTIQKQYIVQNNTAGGQSIIVKTSAGTGITVPNGRKAHLYVNGTNVIQMFDFVNILGGTIDNTTLGATTASSARVTTLNASGATTLDGTVALGNAAGDLITVPGTVNSNLLFTDNSFDIGATGANRPRNLFLSGNATMAGNLSVGGTLTLTGGVNLNGNVTVGDTSADTLTINATITSNLLFTDNTYDIGASGATRPRNLFLAGNSTTGGNATVGGNVIVDGTTDSTSTTTGSLQTDGGLGVAKALFVGTTANIAGAVTLGGGTANGVAYLNGSKVLTTGSALTFDGADVGIGGAPVTGLPLRLLRTSSGAQIRYQNTAATWDSGVTAAGAYEIFSAANTSIQFGVNSTEQMRLTSTGLGIGTSSPGSFGRLAVLSGSTASTAFFDTTAANAYSGGSFFSGSTLTLRSGANATGNATAIRFSSNVNGAMEGVFGFVQNASTYGDFVWQSFNGSYAERMRLNSSGQLETGIAGTAAAPSFTRTGDLNTGIFFPAADTIAFAEGGVESMRIDASGNLGLGVTPSAWGSDNSRRGFDISTYGALTSNSLAIDLIANAFFNGTNWVAKTTGAGTKYLQTAGSHFWQIAGSVSAGAQPSYTTAMTLDASGNLGIGTSSPTAKLQLGWSLDQLKFTSPTAGSKRIGASYTGYVSGNDYAAIDLLAAGSSGGQLIFSVTPNAGSLTTAATIDLNGNLGLGVTPSAWISHARVLQLPSASFTGRNDGGIEAGMQANAYRDTGGTRRYVANGVAMRYEQSTDGHTFFTAPSGTAGNAISFTQAMSLLANGTLCVNTTDSAPGSGAIQVAPKNSVGFGANAAAAYYSVANYFNGSFAGGLYVTSGTTALITSSDYRLKNITGSVSNSGTYIDSLKPVEGTWKSDGTTFIGLIAHEAQEVSRTQIATGFKDGEKMQGMSYSSPEMVANIIAELQSLRKRVAELEAK